MKIRREQIKVLESSVLQQFRNGLLAHLRLTFPEQTQNLADEHLLSIVDAEIARGGRYRITAQRDVMLLADLRFFRAPDFEQEPEMAWARRILENPELESEVKMRLIYQCLSAANDHDALS